MIIEKKIKQIYSFFGKLLRYSRCLSTKTKSTDISICSFFSLNKILNMIEFLRGAKKEWKTGKSYEMNLHHIITYAPI